MAHQDENHLSRPHRRVLTVRRLMGIVLVCGLVAWFFSLAGRGREEARCAQCVSHLKWIIYTLHRYHEAHGSFPPAVVTDDTGKPMHSWRVLLYLYQVNSSGDLINFASRYDFSEPWDGPNNRQLHGLRPSFYYCPNHPDRLKTGHTSYLAVVGPGTVFPGPNQSTSLEVIHDDHSNTIAVVESANAGIHWMEPRDLELDTMSLMINDRSRPSISSRARCGPYVAMADASIRSLGGPDRPDPETVRAMLTIAGGETISWGRKSGEIGDIAPVDRPESAP